MGEYIWHFRGKKVEDMNKSELLEVIKYLAGEMNHWKKEYDDNYDVILEKKLDEAFPYKKPTFFNKIIDK